MHQISYSTLFWPTEQCARFHELGDEIFQPRSYSSMLGTLIQGQRAYGDRSYPRGIEYFFGSIHASNYQTALPIQNERSYQLEVYSLQYSRLCTPYRIYLFSLININAIKQPNHHQAQFTFTSIRERKATKIYPIRSLEVDDYEVKFAGQVLSSKNFLILNEPLQAYYKKQTMFTPFLIFTLVGLVSGLDKLGASCELCMQTYKINCTICYDKCVAQKTLKNCTFNQCTSTDSNGNCLIRTPTILNSNNCLGTCCGSTFKPNTPFTQPNFNLCIERDAYQDENVNIGLTLGLILALLGLLFFAGLVCLLFIMFWDEKEPPTASHRVPTGEHINTLEYQKNSDENTDEEWMSDGYILNGMCQICSSGISNVTAHCGHCYHYSCLSRNLNVSGQQRCPLCEQPQSLKSTKIFCSSCKKQYKILRSDKDRFDIRLASNMQKIKCPNCH